MFLFNYVFNLIIRKVHWGWEVVGVTPQIFPIYQIFSRIFFGGPKKISEKMGVCS